MNNVTFSQNNCKEETTSTWLVTVMQFGLKTGFFKPFLGFRLKMKEVKYSIYQKMITMIMSIVMGCEFTKDINEKLAPETLTARLFDMDKVPDQSQINEFLTRMDEQSIVQFQQIHRMLFMEHGTSVHSNEKVIVDIDQTGLIANGKSYELADKGYFAKKKNQSGYQMSAAFTGKHSETVAMFLDSGDTHCTEHFDDLLKEILSKYKQQLREGNLILRTDSGYGSSSSVEKLTSIPNLKFVTKGYSTVSASKLAKDIPYCDFIEADKNVWVYEFAENDGLRNIIVQILTPHGKLKYSLLITNIPATEMDAVALFHFYNGRQTIEAFFKMAKNTYNIKNLRTRRFYGIYAFLWLVFITHNLISRFKSDILVGTELEGTGVSDLVKKLGNVRGFVARRFEEVVVTTEPLTKFAKLLSKILCGSSPPTHIQLEFLI